MRKDQIFSYSTVIGCNVLWGILGIFWDLLSGVSSFYVLAQRICWSALFSFLFLLATGKGDEIHRAMKNKKTLLLCACSGVLITVNWGSYIYAVGAGHTLDTSLGYFIEPMLVVIIGIVFFKEKLRKLETVTILFAAAGIAYLLLRTGAVPGLALVVAGSFAGYSAVKKELSLTPALSLFLETLCVTPLAIVYILWSHSTGAPTAALQGWQYLLLPASGIVTSVPLLLFAAGIRNIPLYFSGILLYLSPTIQFLMGIFYFHETLDPTRLIAFVIIWAGILFTVADKLLMMKNEKKLRTQV